MSEDTMKHNEPVISKEGIDMFTDTSKWPLYRKKVDTRAYRMNEPFNVETREGRLHCEDGYLCIDARGYPYPVAKDEFDLIYAPIVSDE